MAAWGATQAKAKFSEVLDKAETEGPQIVRRRKQEFLVMTREAHDAAEAEKRAAANPFESAWEALQPSFKARYGVDFPRLKGTLRKANLG
jgi:prevent-host-death family protein